MSMRKMVTILLASTLLFCPTTGALCESAEPDYYQIGLEVTALMGEMIDSDAYLSLFSRPETFSEIRERVNTHDYDRPAAVYSVSMDDPASYLEEILSTDPESRETWDSLSPALQNQALTRLSLSTLLANTNARAGTIYVALFSILNAFVRNEALTNERSCYYLYFFEHGAPILVSFSYHAASGQFLSVPGEYRDNTEKIAEYLALPGLELVPISIPVSEGH